MFNWSDVQSMGFVYFWEIKYILSFEVGYCVSNIIVFLNDWKIVTNNSEGQCVKYNFVIVLLGQRQELCCRLVTPTSQPWNSLAKDTSEWTWWSIHYLGDINRSPAKHTYMYVHTKQTQPNAGQILANGPQRWPTVYIVGPTLGRYVMFAGYISGFNFKHFSNQIKWHWI